MVLMVGDATDAFRFVPCGSARNEGVLNSAVVLAVNARKNRGEYEERHFTVPRLRWCFCISEKLTIELKFAFVYFLKALGRLLLLGIFIKGSFAVRICGGDATTTGSASRSSAPIVVIEGFVDYQQHPINANLSRWQRTPFQIRVSGSNWLARLVPSNDSYDYTEIGSDGVDCYWMDCYKSVVERARQEGRKTGTNVAAANVRASPVPLFSMSHQMGAIWLTYASAFYFDRITNLVAESPHTIGARQGAIRFPDDYSLQPVVFERFDTPLTLNVPRSITYFDQWIDPRGTARSIRLSAITNLSVNAEFKVLAVTNRQGVRVALSSQLIGYARLGIGEVHVHEYHVQSTNVTVLPHGPLDPKPAIVGVTLFTDERFNTGNGLHFNYLAERWLDREEVAKLPEYKRAKALADSRSRFKAQGKWFKYFLIAFTLLVGMPLFVFLWRQLSGSSPRAQSPIGRSD